VSKTRITDCGHDCYRVDITSKDMTDTMRFNSIGLMNYNSIESNFTVSEVAIPVISIFNLDFTNTPGLVFLGLLIILYLGLMIAGMLGKNDILTFASGMFGIFIGLMLLPIHFLLTVIMVLCNILIIIYNYRK